MADPQLGVAIHGAGWVAGAHGRSWLKQSQVRIISISDVDRQRAERLASQLGLQCAIRESLEEVLADPAVDIVDICTPSHLHAQHGIQAAQAGRHILVEKPIALTLSELRSLREMVQQAGVKGMASFVLRWNPMLETIHRLIQSGAIGRVFYAEADYWHNIPCTHHAWPLHSKRATAGSAMLLAGCHAVDILRWLLADEAEEVSAVGTNPTGRFEYPPNVVAWIRFRGGAVGKVSVLLDCQMPYRFQVELAGTEGTIWQNRIWSSRLFPCQSGWTTVPTVLPDSADVQHHPFDAEIGHFVQCILEDQESHCSIADAYYSHEVCLAIDRSLAQGGQPVRLPLE
ncbi:MAG: Gfo/Idh/MocA family oxidoreductase [Thermoguttaceae bacterium]|nr:Gfo/Idh/MocA family oxidoreductase [Thermoguttaceae bacterium]MDW8037735.1 Gfo/Idh/MocA family oxidoreductase [Thermoguttaceae bacterium]